jgi:hypothetical protein
MNFKELYIPPVVVDYFTSNQKKLRDFGICNAELEKTFGIKTFFNNTDQLNQFIELVAERNSIVAEPNRREYGDFQTNSALALKSVDYIKAISNVDSVEFVLEPTCGKGSFIIAALTKLSGIKRIVGVEIYQPYVWETKFKILEFFLEKPSTSRPSIEIIHANVFDFNFEKLSKETKKLQTLVIGNPPWVTNSELSSMDSKNLPEKSNFKKHSGYDAITGKGNFDIGEFISLLMLKHFSSHQGYFGFLVKNSVVKNLLFDQKNHRFPIGKIGKLTIDAKREFNVSVDACFFVSKFNNQPEVTCTDIDFYSLKENRVFGWVGNNFVNSVVDYKQVNDIDGKCQFVWRQGIKHDCSKVMEIEKCNGHYINGLNHEFDIESDLVYGLLKSSDLKKKETNSYRKLTIVTQKKIGQSTDYIRCDYPQTYEYLYKNKEFFDKRKSSIYKGKPQFSIFGVGDYSFMPYKIAVSGMYKSTHFTLVLPSNGKPLMLDDTCYFIGFKEERFAKIVLYLLNHEHTQQFLKAVVFPDSKRSITKDVLMRIDLVKLCKLLDHSLVVQELGISVNDWSDFQNKLEPKTEVRQMALF